MRIEGKLIHIPIYGGTKPLFALHIVFRKIKKFMVFHFFLFFSSAIGKVWS